MAALFGVTVDYLLSSHDAWEKPKDEDEEEPPSYSVDTIIALALVSVMTVALTVFVTLWIIGIVEWRIFLIGISVTLLTYMVLDCVFKGARRSAVHSLSLCVQPHRAGLFLHSGGASVAAFPAGDTGGDHSLPRLQHPQKSASSPQAEVWQRLLKSIDNTGFLLCVENGSTALYALFHPVDPAPCRVA